MNWKKLLKIAFKIYSYLCAALVTLVILSIALFQDPSVPSDSELTVPCLHVGAYILTKPEGDRSELFEKAALSLHHRQDKLVLKPATIERIMGKPDEIDYPIFTGMPDDDTSLVYSYLYVAKDGENARMSFGFSNENLAWVGYGSPDNDETSPPYNPASTL